MHSPSRSQTQNRLIAINVLFIASAIISVIGAWEIAKGATLHRLNLQHVKFNTQLREAVENSGGVFDLNHLQATVLGIRRQPETCLRIMGPLEIAALHMAGTSAAVELCRKDIADADAILADMRLFRSGVIGAAEMEARLRRAIETFETHSAAFEPLVDQTVRFVFAAMLTLLAFKGAGIAGVGLVLSKRISAQFATLEDTTALARDRQRRLDLALENASDAVWEWDLATGLGRASPQFFAMLGRPFAETADVRATVYELVHPDDLEALENAWERHAKTGEPYRVTTRMRRADGEWIWVRHKGGIQRDASGKAVRASGMLSDVTEIMKARVKAERANRAKSEFLANMSHEVRTPLNAVLGMAQALARSDLSDAQAEQISVIIDSGAALMNILNDILDLSKIEAGKLDVIPSDDDLPEHLGKLVSLWTPRAQEKGLALELDDSRLAPDRLCFDGGRIRQCMNNLISNAVKFTDRGKVKIRARATPKTDDRVLVAIEVADTGPGVPGDIRDEIFSAFSQGDGSPTRAHGGTGLGLAIARNLARQMGGDITVADAPGGGALFTLTFEAEKAAEPADASPRLGSRTLTPAAGASLPEGLRILIVDDHPQNRAVARLVLQQFGVETEEAEDGWSALERLAAGKFDLVLLDRQMPGLDGAETLARIRAAAAPWRDVPVIALTGKATDEDRHRAQELGVDGYVVKPFDSGALEREIARVLSRPEARKRAGAA